MVSLWRNEFEWWMYYAENMIRWYKTYIKSLRRDIVNLLFLDMIFLVVMELILKAVPAPFPIFVKFGKLFVTLAISFLASFVFYFVQVHLPAVKDKEEIYPSLAKLFGSMLGLERILLTQLLGIKMEEMSEDKIKSCVEKLDLYSEAPLTIGSAYAEDHRANWIEYCLYRVERIDNNWNLLIQYSNYLDSECMSLLMRIQNEDIFLDQVRRKFPICNGNRHRLSIVDSHLFVDFWHFINEQEDYYKRVFASYCLNGH